MMSKTRRLCSSIDFLSFFTGETYSVSGCLMVARSFLPAERGGGNDGGDGFPKTVTVVDAGTDAGTVAGAGSPACCSLVCFFGGMGWPVERLDVEPSRSKNGVLTWSPAPMPPLAARVCATQQAAALTHPSLCNGVVRSRAPFLPRPLRASDRKFASTKMR
jgi:hypothetical protein